MPSFQLSRPEKEIKCIFLGEGGINDYLGLEIPGNGGGGGGGM